MKEFKLKILTAGEFSVGKTTFLKRYTTGEFIENLKLTIGVEFFSDDIQVHDTLCHLVIWDFGGQPTFRQLLSSYVSGAQGALFMFSLPHVARTLRKVNEWLSILNNDGPIPILLIGTKSDLVNEYDFALSKDLIAETKEKYDFIDYIETSSKTGENVKEAIENLVSFIVNKLQLKTKII